MFVWTVFSTFFPNLKKLEDGDSKPPTRKVLSFLKISGKVQFLDDLSFGNALGKNRYGELWDRLITTCTHLTWQSKCSFCIKVFLQTLHIKFSCNLAFLHSQKALAFCHMAFYKCWLLIIWHFDNLAVFWSGNFSNGYLTSGVLSYGEFETGDISEQPFQWHFRNIYGYKTFTKVFDCDVYQVILSLRPGTG